eukprot:259884-Rhodomonas_salina.1
MTGRQVATSASRRARISFEVTTIASVLGFAACPRTTHHTPHTHTPHTQDHVRLQQFFFSFFGKAGKRAAAVC